MSDPNRLVLHPDDTPLPDPAVLDVEALAVVVGIDPHGEAGMLDRVLGLFITDSRQYLQDLRGALQISDAAHARRIVHTLKSSAATVGARAFAALAAQLEARAAAGDLDALRTQASALDAHYNAAVTALTRWRASYR